MQAIHTCITNEQDIQMGSNLCSKSIGFIREENWGINDAWYRTLHCAGFTISHTLGFFGEALTLVVDGYLFMTWLQF